MITTLIGSVASLLLVGVALIVARRRHHLPGSKPGHWTLTACIVLMLLAGTEMTFAGAGSWMISALMWAKNALGGAGPTVFALATLVLFLAVAVAIIKHPSDRSMWSAFALPLLCATFPSGAFHQVNLFLGPIAQQVTTQISTFLGA